MTKIAWNETGSRVYEYGIDRGVVYISDRPGIPWAGLISVSESPEGGGTQPLFYDGVKYMDVWMTENYGASIDAYSMPPELNDCVGNEALIPGLYATNQSRERFGFSYRSLIGNDVQGQDFGYKLHLVYNATIINSSDSTKTLENSLSPVSKKFDIRTVPVVEPGFRPTSHFVLDSTQLGLFKMRAAERLLYGSENTNPRLPTITQLIAAINAA